MSDAKSLTVDAGTLCRWNSNADLYYSKTPVYPTTPLGNMKLFDELGCHSCVTLERVVLNRGWGNSWVRVMTSVGHVVYVDPSRLLPVKQ